MSTRNTRRLPKTHTLAISVCLALALSACAGNGASGVGATPLPAASSAPPVASPAALSSPSPLASPSVLAQASPSPQAQPASSVADWPTYHRDLTRTGVAPSGLNATGAHQAWTSETLDGAVYAEPLAEGSTAYVATEGDSVYALNVSNGQTQWKTNFGTPVNGSELPCGNINPSGITSTPVLDPAANILYVVAFLEPLHHELIALDAGSGNILYRQTIDPPGSDPHTQQQRAALTLNNGTVYVGYGGLDGDCAQYWGWVVAANASNGTSKAVYQVPVQREGAIWAPGGPAIDNDGNVYVVTGNASSTTFDYGDSILKLSGDQLTLLDSFTPSNWPTLSQRDLDLSSVTAALLGNNLLFQIGKEGVGFLVNTTNMGGIGGQLFSQQVCNGGAYGADAYAPPYLYVPCRDGLTEIQINGSSFTTVWKGPQGNADPPIVIGSTVWTAEQASGTLYALDAASGQVQFQTKLASSGNSLPHFITPTAAGNLLLISEGTDVLALGSS